MSTKLVGATNPFESPVKPKSDGTDVGAQQPDILATADLLLEQLKGLESLCSTVEERVQRKRRALKELEYLISESNSTEGSPRSPGCPANTPIHSRLRLVSPRLRGLFDLRGPGQANLDAIQSCLDYSPGTHGEDDNLSTCEDPGHSDDWVNDDEQALLFPYDDKDTLVQVSPKKVGKTLPALPREKGGEVLESKIPRKLYVRRQVSTTKRFTGRPASSAVIRSTSHRRRPSVRSSKATSASTDLTAKGTMRRGSWKRSIIENVQTKGGAKVSSTIENTSSKGNARRKEKRKGVWSIYSVCSELGLSGTH
ncbi:hypothetical protein JVU11DRAFT_9009 [Chiua virens]|nr:hypothetical protein JVU11DRAFT_9009 [Chiua virens]